MRRKHLDRIKEKVFVPLLNKLKDYYIPVLERKISGIEILYITIEVEEIGISRIGRIIADDKRELVSGICKGSSLITENMISKEIDNTLLEDVRNHYPEFMRRWDNFGKSFSECVEGNLSLARGINDLIVERTEMPKWSPCLAKFVFDKLYCLKYSGRLEVGDEGTRIMLYGSTSCAEGSREQIEKCMEVNGEVLKDENVTSRFKPLIERTEKIGGIAINLERELKRLCESFELKGNCKYCE